MSKIYVLHENPAWVEPLRTAFDTRGIDAEEWILAEGLVPFDRPPPQGIFYNRMSASSHTRGHRFAPELTHAVLNWLTLHNRRVINGPRALYLEVSKVAQYAALEQAGIRTPRTQVAVGRDAVIEAAGHFAPEPFILKPNRGGKGLGVHLFETRDQVAAYLSTSEAADEAPIDGLWLIQDYIRTPQPFITRCEFIGGRFHYAVKVETGGSFELCPADACAIDGNAGTPSPAINFEIVEDVAPKLIEAYEKFLQANEIEVAGIEFIRDANGDAYTYDVNTNTNYNADAERKAGIPETGMEAIARFLQNELNKQPSATDQVAAAE
jgi:glutathione synthase/RimK-type ligase-like ATP-grasp enzyme